MSRIIRPLISPTGRVITLTGATIWLVALVLLSPGAESATHPAEAYAVRTPDVQVESFAGVDDPLFKGRSLTPTRRGTILVTDTGNNRVLEVGGDDLDQAVRSFGSLGEGPGEMVAPYGTAIDGHGNVFVADAALGRVTKYSPEGDYLASVPHHGAASVLVTSDDEVLAWPGDGNAFLTRYSNDLEQMGTVLERTDPMRQRAFTDNLFAMDGEDRLYRLDQQSLTIHVHDGRDGYREIASWTIDVPGLRADIRARLQRLEDNPTLNKLNPIKQMLLGSDGHRLALTYHNGATGLTDVFVYRVDGRLDQVIHGLGYAYAATFDETGRLLAADNERLMRWSNPGDLGERPAATLTASMDDDN